MPIRAWNCLCVHNTIYMLGSLLFEHAYQVMLYIKGEDSTLGAKITYLAKIGVRGSTLCYTWFIVVLDSLNLQTLGLTSRWPPIYGKLLFTWLSLVMSMMVSFCAVLLSTRCLEWDLELNWVSFWEFSYLLLIVLLVRFYCHHSQIKWWLWLPSLCFCIQFLLLLARLYI